MVILMAVSFPQNPQEGDSFASGNYVFVFTDDKWVSAVVNPNYQDIQGATGATGPEGGGSGTTVNYNGASAWGTFNGASAILEGSLNVASLTRISDGAYTITFTTPMPNSDYSLVVASNNNSTLYSNNDKTANGFNVYTYDSDVALADATNVSFAVHSANTIAPPAGVGADAWGDISSAGAINGSYNIDSVVKNGAGSYTVTFTVPMPTDKYSVTTGGNVPSVEISSRTVNGFDLFTYDSSGAPDSKAFSFAVHASSTVTPTYTWTRDGTTLKPANDGDDVEAKNISTAWVNFAGSSQLIRSEYNVTSITRISEGSYRVNFTVPMDNPDYAAMATSTNFITAIDSQTTTSLDISTFDNTFTRADSSIICIVIYGGKS